jgi:hypothetical protein
MSMSTMQADKPTRSAARKIAAERAADETFKRSKIFRRMKQINRQQRGYMSKELLKQLFGVG